MCALISLLHGKSDPRETATSRGSGPRISSSLATRKLPPCSAATELAGLLDSTEMGGLIAELEGTGWTGRPGYPLRAMVGMALAKSMY
jgi:hypothetical protein